MRAAGLGETRSDEYRLTAYASGLPDVRCCVKLTRQERKGMPISNSHSNGGISPNIVDPRFRESLRKHNTRLGHTEALEAYCHRLRAQAAQGAGEFVSTFATGALAASAPQAASAQAA